MMWFFVLAAAVGAILRYMADLYIPRHGILIVNILGSLVAGIVTGLAFLDRMDPHIAVILIGGFAGSLTTYSTVALTAALQHINGTGSPIITWGLHLGSSIAAALLGLVSTVVLWS